ncbi:hypothetical protein [Aestuariirhabdus litorea]|nr:hypothetical protein [Aestuariirhabdus litorea]
MRMAAPVVVAVWLIESREGLAALFVLQVALLSRHRLQWRCHWRHYLK